jgi:hypothetical protein
MAMVLELVKELADAAQLLEVRLRLPGSAEQNDKVSNDIVKSICQKIAGMKKMDSPSALKLFQTLGDVKMPQQLVLQVQNAIDRRLASNSVDACASGVAASSSVSQKLLGNIVHYFTKKDWETLHGKKSLQSMQQVVMDRLLACGISHPHEQTVKWAVAVILHAQFDNGGTFPTYKSIHAMVEDYKEQHGASRKPSGLHKIAVYPELPSEMPQEHWDAAYSVDDPPISVSLARLNNLANNHIPLRKNSALLKKDSQSPSAAPNSELWDGLRTFLEEQRMTAQNRVPALEYYAQQRRTPDERQQGSPTQGDWQSHANMFEPCDAQQRRTNFALRDPMGPSSVASPRRFGLALGDLAERASIVESSGHGHGTAEQLPDGVAATAAGVGAITRAGDIAIGGELILRGSSADAISAETYERQAFDALNARNLKRKVAALALKKPAAAGAADATDEDDEEDDGSEDKEDDEEEVVKGPVKKPAGSVKAAPTKKPAGSVKAAPPTKKPAGYKVLKDIPKVIWTAADKMKSCGAYTSYWYDSTKRKAIALGRASPNDLAKAAYAEARELWDKHNP